MTDHRTSDPASPAPLTPADRAADAATERRHRWLMAGAALAGGAVLNQVAARRAEAANPPEGRFVEVDGIRLHYVARGDGPAVLLLHGNGVTLQDYEASGVFAAAVGRHRVIAMDRPGFGYSARPRSTVWTPAAQGKLIARALRQLGIEEVVVVGHSWGTMAALAMALDRPDLVRGLVLLSGYYYPTARPDVIPFSLPAVPILGDVMAHTISPLAGLLTGPLAMKASFAPAPVSPKIAALPTALMLRPSQIRATAADTAMMVPAAAALAGRYGELDMPVRILAGEGDLIAHVGRHSERLAGEVAGSDLRIVAGQGHLFHYAVPDLVADAITAAWDAADAGRESRTVRAAG